MTEIIELPSRGVLLYGETGEAGETGEKLLHILLVNQSQKHVRKMEKVMLMIIH